MKVLLFGFYDQANLGDDLMALMFAEMVRELGAEPVIFTRNPRFARMGYRTTDDVSRDEYGAILLSGGAFFKAASASNAQIEERLTQIASALRAASAPIVGVSLGSDGVSRLDQISPARRAIVESATMGAVAVRLQSDLDLGLPNLEYLPDIVFATRYFRERTRSLGSVRPQGPILVNLSRRSATALPAAFRIAGRRGLKSFLAHDTEVGTGGEIALPLWPRYVASDIDEAIDALHASEAIISSKLHPGIMALSLGREFYSVRPRPKTKAFIEQYERQGLIRTEPGRGGSIRISPRIDVAWQSALWTRYKQFLRGQLPFPADA